MISRLTQFGFYPHSRATKKKINLRISQGYRCNLFRQFYPQAEAEQFESIGAVENKGFNKNVFDYITELIHRTA